MPPRCTRPAGLVGLLGLGTRRNRASTPHRTRLRVGVTLATLRDSPDGAIRPQLCEAAAGPSWSVGRLVWRDGGVLGVRLLRGRFFRFSSSCRSCAPPQARYPIGRGNQQDVLCRAGRRRHDPNAEYRAKGFVALQKVLYRGPK